MLKLANACSAMKIKPFWLLFNLHPFYIDILKALAHQEIHGDLSLSGLLEEAPPHPTLLSSHELSTHHSCGGTCSFQILKGRGCLDLPSLLHKSSYPRKGQLLSFNHYKKKNSCLTWHLSSVSLLKQLTKHELARIFCKKNLCFSGQQAHQAII